MAQVRNVVFSSKQECLTELANSLGVYPPRQPIPPFYDQLSRPIRRTLLKAAKIYGAGEENTSRQSWFDVFDKWYDEILADPKFAVLERPGYFEITLRLEAFTEDDEDEDYDEDED